MRDQRFGRAKIDLHFNLPGFALASLHFGDEQSRRGLPGLIDWPRLGGWLAGNDRHQHHSELVFVVTPRRLVRAQGAV
ncbi:MAG: hypothetical protein EBW39_12425 [Betaproteobacteria bacterium]|nr:hypothetical protein [Betaproteobacteria bacterium]